MRVGVQLIILAGIAAALLAGWWWLAAGDGAAQADRGRRAAEGAGVLVLVEPVVFEQERIVVRAIGTGKALRSVDLYPSTSGEVMAKAFVAGEEVLAGQPLLRLDAEQERIAVRLAEVAVQEAARQVQRYEELAPSGTVAMARLQTARAELESARLRLDQAREALDDRTVFAPFDGVVGLTDIDRGDRITPETFIATLDDRSALEVEFTIPESVAVRVAPGDTVTLTAWTLPGEALTATVSAMGSQIDPVSRSLRLRALLPNPEGRIRPGTSFQVRLDIVGGRYPVVREVAVLWSRDGAYVWRVAEDQRAERVFAKVVRRDRGRVLLDSPLAEGDRIVVEGVQGLRAGTRVDPQPFGRAATPDSEGTS